MLSDIKDFLSYSLNHQDAFKPFYLTVNGQLKLHAPCPGILEFDPQSKKETKAIILSAGVHGNESAPIELLNKIIEDILDGELTVKHRVLFIFANLPSIERETRFIEENLNRLFHYGPKSDNAEANRANQLMQEVSAFFESSATEKLHYDLHTAIRPSKNEKFAVYPYLHGRQHDKRQLRFLSACNVNTILLSQSPTGTFSYYSSSQHGAHAFTLELGKVKPFGQNDMTRFVDMDNMLRQLISEKELTLPSFGDCPLDVFNVNQTIIKNHDDFKLHFEDDAPNFTSFKAGSVLASETGKSYKAEVDGEAIVFPNANIPNGQRALLTVIPYEI